MSRSLNIPRVGTELTLAEDWTFTVVNEHRNKTLIEWMTGTVVDGWAMYPLGGHYRDEGQKPWERTASCTLPKGTILKIDRIYLRKGSEDSHNYDSVTFITQNLKTDSQRTIWSRTDRQDRKQKIKTRLRFFAKLDDVNKMVVE